MPAGARRRAAPGGRAGRGAGVPPVPVRAATTCAGSTRPTAPPIRRTARAADRRGARPGRACSPRPASATGPTRWACGSGWRIAADPAHAARAADPRRADQRARPAGHPRGARADQRRSPPTGATVMLSTHLLAEVEQICTHVGVMHRGRLVAQAPLAQLRAGGRAAGAGARPTSRPTRRRVLRALGLADVARRTAARRRPASLGAGRRRRRWSRRWCTTACRCAGSRSSRPSLEDLFVSLTGEGFDVSG